MPELPEVQTVVSGLDPVLRGNTIQDIHLLWPRSIEGDAAAVIRSLKNRRIHRVYRRGKYILIDFTGLPSYTVTVHLRMTGKLLFKLEEKDVPYVRVEFKFQGGDALYFVDIRKFGRIKLWQPGETLLPCLGPEPLDESTVYCVLSGLKTGRAIKTVLLDQRVLAGIGNIYADEALHLAGIHPLTPANTMPESKQRILGCTIPRILKEAIDHKGTTLSDYVTPDNRRGEHQEYLYVYGREGDTCKGCATPIVRLCINGRSSHFCPECQPSITLPKD